MTNNKRIQMLMPIPLLEKIDDYAKKIGESRSNIIRRATNEFLYGEEAKE
jgi:metal-responsive CopG/Arc/MetJ family transcriptional regulator